MECPREIASILLDLTTLGILWIRSHPGDPTRCMVVADHIHNLPGLVGNYSPARLSFYWEIERPAFIEKIPEGDLAAFASLWEELRVHAESPEAAEAR